MAVGEITKGKVGRKCSICTHDELATINRLIHAGKSFRSISLGYGMAHPSVTRHTQNCLKLDLAAALKDKRVEITVDAIAEFYKNLEFVTKLRAAAEKWLQDPADADAFTVAPRADEVEVVWTSTVMGLPIQHSSTLDKIMLRLQEEANIPNPSPFIKNLDMREYALKVIDRCDVTIDRFAKIQGLYQKDRANLTEDQMAAKIVADLVAEGWTAPAARAMVFPKYGLSVEEIVH